MSKVTTPVPKDEDTGHHKCPYCSQTFMLIDDYFNHIEWFHHHEDEDEDED